MRLFATIIFAVALTACSIPNLEAPECTESRDMVRAFYSFHFGNDMKFTPENLKAREKYLSANLNKLLQKYLTESDPFTLTDDLPRAFKAGGCRVTEPGTKTVFDVLLYWKSDARADQQQINVEAVKEGDKWLINNIYNDKYDLSKTLGH